MLRASHAYITNDQRRGAGQGRKVRLDVFKSINDANVSVGSALGDGGGITSRADNDFGAAIVVHKTGYTGQVFGRQGHHRASCNSQFSKARNRCVGQVNRPGSNNQFGRAVAYNGIDIGQLASSKGGRAGQVKIFNTSQCASSVIVNPGRNQSVRAKTARNGFARNKLTVAYNEGVGTATAAEVIATGTARDGVVARAKDSDSVVASARVDDVVTITGNGDVIIFGA